MRNRFKLPIVLVALLVFSPVCLAETFRIAAASSLQFALREVVEVYVEKTQRPAPKLVFGSSGNLFRQIQQGAPFELFLSARNELVEQLQVKGFSKDNGKQFGVGRLVLLSKSGVPMSENLTDTLTTHVILKTEKLAIANTEHAPYGRAAKQVLEALQLWSAAKPQLVYGEQVSQATQYVVSGASPYGLVSLSLALSQRVAEATEYSLVDDSLHEPIKLQIVQLRGAGSFAEGFYQFVLADETVEEIFKRYGLR